jgi:hypothetical protein
MSAELAVHLLALGGVFLFWAWAWRQLNGEAERRRKEIDAVSKDVELWLEREKQRAAKSPWFALPPDRLELGNTGYYVELNPGDKEEPYHGYTPDGKRAARSAQLAPLKQFLERLAAERAEFAHKAEEHKP